MAYWRGYLISQRTGRQAESRSGLASVMQAVVQEVRQGSFNPLVVWRHRRPRADGAGFGVVALRGAVLPPKVDDLKVHVAPAHACSGAARRTAGQRKVPKFHNDNLHCLLQPTVPP